MPLRDLWAGGSLFLIIIGIVAGESAVAVLGVLLLLAGGVARVWQRLALERVTYQRIFPETRAFVGEKLAFSARLTNRKPLPLPWLEVREQFPEDLRPTEVRLLQSSLPKIQHLTRTVALGWYERVTWRYELECQQRGYFRIGPAYLKSSDLFGLFLTERQESNYQSVVVFPKTVPLSDLALPSQRPLAERRGGAIIYQDPLRIAGLREYEPGDSMRRIDWKATARRGTLQSRVYEPSSTLHMLVALNLTTFEQTWAGYDPALLERAVTVSASLAAQAYEDGYAVGLVTNCSFPDADQPIRIPAGRNPQQLPCILEALATVSPFMITSLEEQLQREFHQLPLGTTVAVVAALLPEGLLAMLSRIHEAGHRVMVLYVRDEDPTVAVKGISIVSLGSYMRRWEMEQALES